MPIFEYLCICGNSFEQRLKVGLPKVKCECGKYARKQVAAHAKTPGAWVV